MLGKTFDYIVVGGGSAGCVLAARLTENRDHRVLLIESGTTDKDPFIHIPAGFFKVIGRGRDVHFYKSEPERGLNGRPAHVPQGNVLGGSSSINAMIYIRGQSADYDHWAQNGCRGWSYERVLPIFKFIEGNQRLSGEFHGASGELRVSDRAFGHPLCWAFIRAAQEAGLSYNDDFNGADQAGVGFYQQTIHAGRRWSAATAFLKAALRRPNLTVMTSTRVARVIFDGRRASGVELEDKRRFSSRGEVILAAGALATPKILQLSGIGSAGHLRSLGIPVVADLPGVGENYQDHLEATVQGESIDPISLLGQDKGLRSVGHFLQYALTHTGLLTSNVVEAGGFADTAARGLPDIQFHVLPILIGFLDRAPEPGHGISIGPCYLRPRSRGTVKLRSPNPREPALFNANALSDPEDVEGLVRGVELGIKILEAPSLARVIKRRVLPKPGIERDRGALRDYVRSVAKTVYHPSGTCKMGPGGDPMAVVAEDLRVFQVEGLRVCDASVMPTLVSGNTNAPTIMIAERGARFILGTESP